jgi:hypothetical protein
MVTKGSFDPEPLVCSGWGSSAFYRIAVEYSWFTIPPIAAEQHPNFELELDVAE